MRNTYALLIAGDEERFVLEIDRIWNYLIFDAGYDPSRVYTTQGATILAETKKIFKRVKRENQREDVILWYSGHGGKGVISAGRDQIFYEDFGRCINPHGKFIFINDSCYSGSTIAAFKKLDLLPHLGMVLTSSAADEESEGDLFSRRLLDSWRQQKYFKEQKISRIEKTVVLESLDQEMPTYVDENGETVCVIGNIGVKERVISQHKVDIQHPQRYGLNLDALLFPL